MAAVELAEAYSPPRQDLPACWRARRFKDSVTTKSIILVDITIQGAEWFILRDNVLRIMFQVEDHADLDFRNTKLDLLRQYLPVLGCRLFDRLALNR